MTTADTFLATARRVIGIEIKAATTHYAVSQDATVQKAIPALCHLASQIGDPAVRNRGTIGGSLANNDPAADYPAAVLALGATLKTFNPSAPCSTSPCCCGSGISRDRLVES